jgi:hypothetical protein
MGKIGITQKSPSPGTLQDLKIFEDALLDLLDDKRRK